MVKVSVLKCSSYDTNELYKTIKQSLKNINFTIPKNKKILIKPNVLGQKKPNTSINTHPAVIDALCQILKEKNNEIWIGDSSGIASYGGTKKAFRISGIEEVAKKHNCRLISFEGSQRKKIIDNNAKIIKKFVLAKEPFLADLIINVPKLKTHVLMRFTGAVKNMFGCVPGGGKSRKHAIAPNEDKFANLLLDIYQNIKPQLNIMDAIMGLEGNGPGSGGNPKKVGLIITSKDAVALDIVASKIIGYDPLEIKTTKYAIERGIFSEKVEVIGEKNYRVRFKKPIRKSKFARAMPKTIIKLMFTITSIKPYIKKQRCKKCKICYNVCPTKAITLDPYPKFNRKKCILCYCCHENCPYKAIELKKNPIIEIYERIKNAMWRINNKKED